MWFVITGGPSSGKTTTLAQLAAWGERTVPEVARRVIEARLAAGESLASIWARNEALQREILRGKVAAEAALSRDGRVFLDRGMHDSEAFFEQSGLPLSDPELRAACDAASYAGVFLLEALPVYVNDAARIETREQAALQERRLAAAYERAGFAVVRIGPASVEDRARAILSACGRGGPRDGSSSPPRRPS